MKHKLSSLQFGKTTISYRIVRKAGSKTIAITVRPNGQILATAPTGTDAVKIEKAMRARAPWILEQLRRLARRAKPVPRQFVSGESFWYLGRQYRLKVQAVSRKLDRAEVAFGRGRFVVHVAMQWGQAKRRREIRLALVRWYRQHAQERLTQSVQRLAIRLGVLPPTVRIHELKNRWASCGAGGTLRFNWRVVMARQTVLEYIAGHELCHHRHKNHSVRFWRLLGSVMPDYPQRREELDLLGPRYNF